MKKIVVLIAVLAITSLANAAGNGDALTVLNTFIATFAKDNPTWKSNIVLLSDPTKVPAGRQLGYSSMIGYYSFTPKTWDQLSEAQQQEIYSDPRLKPFLVSLRNSSNYPSMTSADVPVPYQPVYPAEGITNPAAVRPLTPVNPAMGSQYGQPMPVQPQMQMPQGQMRPAYPQAVMPHQEIYQPVSQYKAPTAHSNGNLPGSVMVKIAPEEMLLDRPLQIFLYNNH